MEDHKAGKFLSREVYIYIYVLLRTFMTFSKKRYIHSCRKVLKLSSDFEGLLYA